MSLHPIFLPYSGSIPFATLAVDDEDGASWIFDVTCNGHAIGALLADVTKDVAFPPPTTPERVKAYQDVLRKPARDRDAVVTLAQLLSIVGEADLSKTVRCDDCGGSGRARNADGDCRCQNCRCECDAGFRWTSPPKRPIVLAGIGVNANLIACTLAALDVADPGFIEVWAERFSETAIRVKLFAKDGAWRACVLGMVHVEDDAPRFLDPETAQPPAELADPANDPLLVRVLAAPSREPTPEEREVLAEFRRKSAEGITPMSSADLLAKVPDEPGSH